MTRVYAIIGKGYGDEGKGLAVDHFCQSVDAPLVIRHNGGAQSGHTVEISEKRFVFHQLGSGSFRGADTFWAETFYPDLYKLQDEIDAFRLAGGDRVHIFCDSSTPVVLIDDVLTNMALETARGNKRHGSCGMGIYEADLRTKAGFGVSAADFLSESADHLVKKLTEIRREYLPARLERAGLPAPSGEYGEMLRSPAVIENAVEQMMRNARQIRIVEDTKSFLHKRDTIIFENGQGLLLDACCKASLPHVTGSRTGLTNPCMLAKKYQLPLPEPVYISRSYVTRHGAGPLANECSDRDLGLIEKDKTNIPNPWQGSLRFARHGSAADFVRPVREDLSAAGYALLPEQPAASLFLTHLNESHGRILCAGGSIDVARFCRLPEIRETFGRFYLSASREAKDARQGSPY